MQVRYASRRTQLTPLAPGAVLPRVEPSRVRNGGHRKERLCLPCRALLICALRRSWVLESDHSRTGLPQRCRRTHRTAGQSAKNAVGVGRSFQSRDARSDSIFCGRASGACGGRHGLYDVQAAASFGCRRSLAPPSDVLPAAHCHIRLGSESSWLSGVGPGGGPNEATIFFIPMAKWSDGTAASMDMR